MVRDLCFVDCWKLIKSSFLKGDAAIRHALAAMETASVVWIPESEHELPYLVDIDDDIPDLVDIDDIHECSKVWYAVLVGKAPGVFDTLCAQSLGCYRPLSNAASGPSLRLLANRLYIAILKQGLGVVSTWLLMRAW